MHHQLFLMQAFVDHEHGRELAAMDQVLDQARSVLILVQHDLFDVVSGAPKPGRKPSFPDAI